MPALSQAQRRLMALAEHSPEKVSMKNRGVLSMGHDELHKMASTPEQSLPKRKSLRLRLKSRGGK